MQQLLRCEWPGLALPSKYVHNLRSCAAAIRRDATLTMVSSEIRNNAFSTSTWRGPSCLRKKTFMRQGTAQLNVSRTENRGILLCLLQRHFATRQRHRELHLCVTGAGHALRVRPSSPTLPELLGFVGLQNSQNRSRISVNGGAAHRTPTANKRNEIAIPSFPFGKPESGAFTCILHSLPFRKADGCLLGTSTRPIHRGSSLPIENGLNITQDALCREALHDPIAFWKKQPTGIHWFSRYKSVFDETRAPFYRWFPGGLLNACYEAVDTHVLTGKGENCAIIYDSPVTGMKQKISYSQLHEKVCAFAAALVRRGVERGDRVLIYMPLVPEAAVAMLACARIGAIHVVTFGGFGRGELAVRIDHAKPKAVVAASCGIEPRRVVPYKAGLEQALQLAHHRPEFKVVLQRPQHIYQNMDAQDVDWDSFLQEGTAEEGPRAEGDKQPGRTTGRLSTGNLGRRAGAAEASSAAAAAAVTREAVPVDSDHPLYILYTSGTTGNPKGIVRDHVGQCVSSLYTGNAIYNINPGDTILCASDLGWVLGHSIMLYGTLINGATTVLYEGKPTTTPDAGAFWRLVSEYGVSKLFTAPSAIRAIRIEDPTGKLLQGKNLETLKAIYLVGEKTDRATMRWLSGVLRKAEKVAESPYVRYPLLVDHWWQTETGWPVTCIMTGFPLKPANFLHRREGSCGKPCPGWDVRIVDDEGEEVEVNVSGHIVLKLPLPPGALTTLYNDDKRYVETYLSRFKGFYDTGDSGFFDEDGYLYIEGRTDDVLNVAAHRLSGLAIEEVLIRHPAVATAAVVAVADSVKGQVPVGIIVPRKAASARRVDEEASLRTKEKSGSTAEQDTSKDGTLKTRIGGVLRTLWAGTEKKPQPTEVRETPRPDLPHTVSDTTRDLIEELVEDVRESVGAFACFKSCVVVSSLPQTRSGKVLRKTMALILEGREHSVPATIEDASALAELEKAVEEQFGIKKSDGVLPIWANGLPNV